MNTKIKKVRLTDADGDVIIYHVVKDGKVEYKLSSVKEVLRTLFYTHYDLYARFGVDWFNANALGWKPGNRDFDPSNSGFARFLRSKGKIREEVLEEMSVDTFVNSYVMRGE